MYHLEGHASLTARGERPLEVHNCWHGCCACQCQCRLRGLFAFLLRGSMMLSEEDVPVWERTAFRVRPERDGHRGAEHSNVWCAVALVWLLPHMAASLLLLIPADSQSSSGEMLIGFVPRLL